METCMCELCFMRSLSFKLSNRPAVEVARERLQTTSMTILFQFRQILKLQRSQERIYLINMVSLLWLCLPDFLPDTHGSSQQSVLRPPIRNQSPTILATISVIPSHTSSRKLPRFWSVKSPRKGLLSSRRRSSTTPTFKRFWWPKSGSLIRKKIIVICQVVPTLAQDSTSLVLE